MVHHKRTAWAVVLALGLAWAGSAWGRTNTGAKGDSYTYFNRSFFNWLVIDWDGRDLPSFDCHVAATKGTSEVDRLGNGTWTKLVVCNTVDGAQKIRVDSRCRLVLEDPWDGYSIAEDSLSLGNDCSGRLPPGIQVWGEGPDDPTVRWPPVRFRVPGWEVWPDTLVFPFPPVRWVIDPNDTNTLMINHPLGGRIIWARSFTPPDTFPIPVPPGSSLRMRADGTLDTPGHVMVCSTGDVTVRPGETAELYFEVWNITAAPISFDITAEESNGWGLMPWMPSVMVPPGAFAVVPLMMVVPPNPVLVENMVGLQATDPSDPAQNHWGGAFVIVDTTVTAVEERRIDGMWLGQCHPNPFNPTTWIPFEVGTMSRVRVDVFDSAGRHIASLLDDVLTPGPHATAWNGTNSRGEAVASGVYFYRLEVEGHGRLVKKMALIK